MAKKRKVNRSQLIRDYLTQHPNETAANVAAAVSKSNLKVEPHLVYQVKSKMLQPPGRVERVRKTAKPDLFRRDHVKQAKQFVRVVGDMQTAKEALKVLDELMS